MQIIAVAVELFSRDGLDSVTVDQIAAAADIGKGTIYNYFKAKEDIVVAFMAEMEEKVQAKAGGLGESVFGGFHSWRRGRRNGRRGREVEDLNGAGVEDGKAVAGRGEREVAAGVEDRRDRHGELNLAGSEIVDLDALAADVFVVERIVGADGMADFEGGAGEAQAVGGAG